MKVLLAALAVAMGQPLAMAAAPPLEGRASARENFTHERLAAAVTPIAERALREQGIVGFSVGIAHQGRPVYLAGFGMADLERQRATTGDTQYEIQSVTKMLTSVAVLQLVEKQLMDLDSPVSAYLPEYQGPLRNAPIRSLLNHTSGFRDGPFNLPAEQLRRAATFEERMTSSIVAKGGLEWPTGSHFRYSNAGYVILALVIEKVAGKPWGEVLRDQIFMPLGMQRSTTGAFNHPDATVYYRRGEDGEPAAVPNFDLSIYDGSGAVLSTPRDLLTFQSALNAGRLLTPASLELMREPTVIRSGAGFVSVPFGLGTAHGPAGGRRKLGHQGTWSGSTVLAHYPDEDLTIAILTNSDARGTRAAHASDLESWIAHAIFRDSSPVFSPTPLPFDEEFAALLTGRFQNPSGAIWDQRWEEGEMRVYIDGALAGQLLRIGPSATTVVRKGSEPAPRLTEGVMSNPPYLVAESSPNGDWIFVHDGGMFFDDFRRLEPTE
jgi:D-alanyl-D-alanine carboxypeptidase